MSATEILVALVFALIFGLVFAVLIAIAVAYLQAVAARPHIARIEAASRRIRTLTGAPMPAMPTGFPRLVRGRSGFVTEEQLRAEQRDERRRASHSLGAPRD